jgi:ABC-type amino acid transport system permease subunit
VNGNIEFRDNKGEVIIFVALVFWIFTYGMSYVSGHIERHLGVGER